MKASLLRWTQDSDLARHQLLFDVERGSRDLGYLSARADDFYIALIGQFFEHLSGEAASRDDWSRLASAFLLLSRSDHALVPAESAIFSAAAFYLGGFSASAYLTAREANRSELGDPQLAVRELLLRARRPESSVVSALIAAVRRGDADLIETVASDCRRARDDSFSVGPEEWVAWSVLVGLVETFTTSNIRAALPNGNSPSWSPLIGSFLDRDEPVWDLFPSQREALSSGLISRRSVAVQMPTGAGKTALTEILLFESLSRDTESSAVLLVPYRALAAELRYSLARRLTGLGLPTRCYYGGTVPSADEVAELEESRAIIATPESFSGILSVDPTLARRISLVVCDEGHLLDSGSRGVALELLLARLKLVLPEDHRFVFISAVVPNIEEVNVWLGGSRDDIVRSTFMPAHTEFGLLSSEGRGAHSVIDLEIRPHVAAPDGFRVERFLDRTDFTYRNPQTRRLNTYPFDSVKARTIAGARRALGVGAVAVFATNKRGSQGVVGLAAELLKQIEFGLPLPLPLAHSTDSVALQDAAEYLTAEFGSGWVGTRSLAAGAVIHHGDLPQEAREVAEDMLRSGVSRFVICTNTLAEGVNLPIRTLFLYSVQRMDASGTRVDLKVRDIRNLVGRAGRPGATTRGLVVCCNPNQWRLIENVSEDAPGEWLQGALLRLLPRLMRAIEANGGTFENADLEGTPNLLTLVDGIDATLVELASDELGLEELVQVAAEVSRLTFAHALGTEDTSALLQRVFESRARKIYTMQRTGQLAWVKRSGLSPRLADAVEQDLLNLWDWTSGLESPTDHAFLEVMVRWAWTTPEMKESVREAYGTTEVDPDEFAELTYAWLSGDRFVAIAQELDYDVDDVLRIVAAVLLHTFHVLMEQAIGALAAFAESIGLELPSSILAFPDHLKFGVPGESARLLMAGGLRHRQAALLLGAEVDRDTENADISSPTRERARRLLVENPNRFRELGRLVIERTHHDLGLVVPAD